jgi:hypothetical protein
MRPPKIIAPQYEESTSPQNLISPMLLPVNTSLNLLPIEATPIATMETLKANQPEKKKENSDWRNRDIKKFLEPKKKVLRVLPLFDLKK